MSVVRKTEGTSEPLVLRQNQPMRSPNTTFDVYLAGNLPPGTPDAAGLSGYLEDHWFTGNLVNDEDRTFLWTATLDVPLGTNLPDLWPIGVSQTVVCAPDGNGDPYTVVFVERRRGFPDFLRAYLIRGSIVSINVKEVDGSPSLTGISTLLFDQADGFVVSQPATGQARIDLALQMSIDVDASGIKLKGDSATPGNSKYYGTDSGGTKGWYALPAAGMSNPMTTLGDTIYENSTPTPARLAGNTTTTRKFLRQVGDGSNSAAPAWDQPTDADLSTSDVTTNNVSTSKHGFVPKAPNDATQYLDGTGAWSVPAGGGGGGPTWQKVTKSHTDFQAASTTKDIEIYSAPAGTVVHAVKIKHSTQFAGTGFLDYTVSVGVSGDLNFFAGAYSVAQPVTAQHYYLTLLAAGGGTLNSNANAPSHTASTSIRAQATSSGANLNQSTAGSVDIWLLVSTAT